VEVTFQFQSGTEHGRVDEADRGHEPEDKDTLYCVYLEIFQISEYFSVFCLAKDGRVRPVDEYVNAVGKGLNVGTLTGQL
jgi:mannose-1-phosphate guanylyltransferase